MKNNLIKHIGSLSAKELRGVSGIYKLICKNRFYIGSSKNIYDRIREHRSRLIANKHNNDFMSKCCKKYGIDSFYYQVIEFCSEDIRHDREQHYIDTLKPDFNLDPGPLKSGMHVYSKKKLSTSIQLKKGEGKYTPKWYREPIEVYDPFGNFVKEYKNIEECIKQTGFTKKKIIWCAGGYKKGTLHKGFRFRYKNSKVKPKKFKYKVGGLLQAFDFIIENTNGSKKTHKYKGIKEINQFLIKNVMDGNMEFKFKVVHKGSD